MCTPYTELNVPEFKARVLEGGPRSYSFGREADLARHVEMLRAEFSGKTYLEFFHAARSRSSAAG